jgi:hypothetical protein
VPDQITSAPTLLASTKTSIQITWIAPYNGGSVITGYKIFINGGGSSTIFTDVTSSGTLSGLTFTTASTLTTGQTYKFVVIATNAVGDSTMSPQSANLMAAVLPGAPATISKVSADASSITVGWTSPSDSGGTTIQSYNVYYNGGGSSTTYTLIASVSGATLQYQHTGLSPAGGTFAYEVSAVNFIGEGP